MIIKCAFCNKEREVTTGHYNRAVKINGGRMFCNRSCVGKFKRTTKAEKIEVKRLYDLKYRKENTEALKKKKKAYYKKMQRKSIKGKEQGRIMMKQELNTQHIVVDQNIEKRKSLEDIVGSMVKIGEVSQKFV